MSSTRQQILEGAYACVERTGMATTTMDDIARAAGVSRATVYRAFPGGRDEVLDATVVWEVARFFARISAAIQPDDLDTATVLERGLLEAYRALEHHAVLQSVLRDEADRLLPPLATVMPMVQAALADWFRPRLEATALRPGVEPAEAADLVARMALSYLGSPGRWDLTDGAQVRTLVEDHLLAAVLP